MGYILFDVHNYVAFLQAYMHTGDLSLWSHPKDFLEYAQNLNLEKSHGRRKQSPTHLGTTLNRVKL